MNKDAQERKKIVSQLLWPEGKSSFFKIISFISSLLLIVLIGYVDTLTKNEISINVFYLIPISIIAWYIGPKSAYSISLLAAISWFFADMSNGSKYTHFLIPYWNTVGLLIFFLILAHLITQLKKEYLLQKQMATEDFLTKILNERAFYNSAKIELSRSERYKRPLTFIYLDLDNFKAVNDSLGHSEGDKLLYNLANTIRTNTRLTDTVARLGGDEFGILLPEMDSTNSPLFVTKIQLAVRNEMTKNNWPVSLSAGAVTFFKTPKNVDNMIKLADRLMYSAKKHGKDQVKYLVCK